MIDLGVGNLRSVERVLGSLSAGAGGLEVVRTHDREAIEQADVVVVPGQAAFGDFIRSLRQRELDRVLHTWLEDKRPYIGICMGMQILFDGSEESSEDAGLGFFSGSVRRFGQTARVKHQKVPHMGWNRVVSTRQVIDMNDWFYFVHSYYCVPQDQSIIAGRTHYIEPFCAALAAPSLFACQFHPEKSQRSGQRLLQSALNHVLQGKETCS